MELTWIKIGNLNWQICSDVGNCKGGLAGMILPRTSQIHYLPYTIDSHGETDILVDPFGSVPFQKGKDMVEEAVAKRK